MVNSAPVFTQYPQVMNAASHLIYDVFGQAIGDHARVAIGVAGLPWNVPVEIEAELEIACKAFVEDLSLREMPLVCEIERQRSTDSHHEPLTAYPTHSKRRSYTSVSFSC